MTVAPASLFARPGLSLLVCGGVSLLVGAAAASRAGDLSTSPLAARSIGSGTTLFTRLAAEETGIVTENHYADPQMWAERFQEFTLGAIGTGVAIGDYDADGRPDLFVVSKTESPRLFRNQGGWRFENVTERAGLGGTAESARIWKQGATFTDVNNDGLLDLYLCRFNAPNLLYVNQGDGTFREEAATRGLALVDACSMAAFCDFDRDGWLDVYVQTNMLDAATHPRGQRDHLLRNQGGGHFVDVSDRLGPRAETLGHSATWWDYNRDGWPDLYVANDFAQPDFLYRNNGDGTFVNVLNEVVPHTPYSSMGADTGDINNDGLPDLLVADMAASTPEKDQRGMAESRLLNNETSESPTEAPQYMRNTLYLNAGIGRCLEAAHLAGLSATDWTWAVRLEDLDNDGRLDAFFCNGMVRELHNLDLLARVMKTENPADRVGVMRSSPVLKEQNFAFRNLGDLHFEEVGTAWGLAEKGVSFGAAFGDLDGDGDLDLVHTNYQGGVSVYRNDSASGHRLVVALRGTRSNRLGVGAEVEIETAAGKQLRTLVLARGYLSSSEPLLHFGLGKDDVVRQLTVKWPGGAVSRFSDLPADHRLIVTEPEQAVDPAAAAAVPASEETLFEEVSTRRGLALLSRERTVPETTLQPLLPHRQNRRGPFLAAADLNGDARDDLIVGGTPLDPLRFAFAAEGAPFQLVDGGALTASKALNDGPIVISDFNGDGLADLLLTRSGTALPADAADYQPRLFFGTTSSGLQLAQPEALPSLPVSVGAAAAADFDRDGKLDLFLGGRVVPRKYPLPARGALLVNRGGRFENVTSAVAPELAELGLVTGAVWTDLDVDGWPDLVVSLEWGHVRVFHNESGTRFTDWTERLDFSRAGMGWWTCVVAADFNGDGRPDIFAGNVGLNTPFTANTEHPLLALYGDFRGNGSAHLIEALHDGTRWAPRFTRSQLGAVLPEVTKRFPRNDAYARASLEDIFGAERVAAARRFTASELRSGVFLSQSDGTYAFKALPRLAQIAPAQSAAAGDVDRDGRADLLLAQNSYSPIPYTGRFDGGLGQVLLGDGRGEFTPVSPARSGFVVPGDAKSIVTLRLDNDEWPDFVVSRNNGTLLAFRHRGKPPR